MSGEDIRTTNSSQEMGFDMTQNADEQHHDDPTWRAGEFAAAMLAPDQTEVERLSKSCKDLADAYEMCLEFRTHAEGEADALRARVAELEALLDDAKASR